MHDISDYFPSVYGFGDTIISEHADCYDGKYISNCEWNTKGMAETGKMLKRMLPSVKC